MHVAISSGPRTEQIFDIWSSGAVLTHAHGPPDLARIALFIVSAIAGYNVFGGVARRLSTASADDVDGDVKVVGGMLNWLAVGCAVSASWVCSHLASAVAWAVGPGTATLVHLALAVLQLAASEVRAGA